MLAVYYLTWYVSEFTNVKSHNLLLYRCILGGKLSIVCLVRRGTSVLWSVSTVIDLPVMKLLKRSHAHVTTKTSFFFGAYFASVAVIDLEMNGTGFHVFGSSSCNWTAPRPYDDGSAAIFLTLLGSTM